MAGERVERRLSAIFASDIVGYSRLMEADEEGTLARMNAHRREFLEPAVAQNRGRIVKRTGDGVLIEFSSAVDAARCAIDVQRGMGERNAGVSPERRIELRIGIHVGDIMIEDDDIFGDGVNIAARLESIAQPGGICISDDAYRQVRGKVNVNFQDSGEQELKNIARPVRVYQLRPEAATGAAKPASGLALPDKPSIAVLAFQNMSGDVEQEFFADERLMRAVELDPNSSLARGQLGVALSFGGEPDRSIAALEDAKRLSPRDYLMVIWHAVDAWSHLHAERFADAMACAKQAIEFNPTFPDSHGILAAAAAQLGQMTEAQAGLAEFVRLLPELTLSDPRLIRPFRRPADRERFFAGLRKAGLAE